MSATVAGLLQVGALLLVLAAVYVPFGNYLARVYTSAGHWRVERALYRLVRVHPDSEQRWTAYAAGVLGCSLCRSYCSTCCNGCRGCSRWTWAAARWSRGSRSTRPCRS
jgi:K+-transporting ATPase A subunit